MSRYLVQFVWDGDAEDREGARRELAADTIETAKLEAAIMYAEAASCGAPPAAYRILQNGDREVYRYPEGGARS
jgi:hypothetical protein